MKLAKCFKYPTVLLLCALTLLFAVSCGDAKASGGGAGGGGAYDFDFTTMSQSVAYSRLYNFMEKPTDYVGKTFKIKGDYYIQNDGGNTYYYIVLNDTTACCSAYIEVIPGACELPEQGSNADTGVTVPVTATGKIVTYQEAGSTYYVLSADTIAR